MDGDRRKPSGGRLLALDQDGFVVLEVDGKLVLVPKPRIDALVETE